MCLLNTVKAIFSLKQDAPKEVFLTLMLPPFAQTLMGKKHQLFFFKLHMFTIITKVLAEMTFQNYFEAFTVCAMEFEVGNMIYLIT